MSQFIRPDRPKARRSRIAKLLAIRQPQAAWRISPILAALPLAVLAAVFLWGGAPPGFANGFTPAAGRASHDPEVADFGNCMGRQEINCVISGDSLRYQGRQIRLADIDAPGLGNPGCDAELARGQAAEARLQQLLNQGPFRLEPTARARDSEGRELFVLTREDASLGKVLEREGLAACGGGEQAALVLRGGVTRNLQFTVTPDLIRGPAAFPALPHPARLGR